MKLCGACGVAVPPGFDYSPTGDIECVPCSQRRSVDTSEKRSAGTVKGAANAALFFGVLSLLFNPVLMFSFCAIASAIYPLVSIGSGAEHARVRRHLSSGDILHVSAFSLVGLLCGLLPFLVAGLVLLAML